MSHVCRICGKGGFKNVLGLGSHVTQVHPGEHWIAKEDIQRLYHGEGMSMVDLAGHFDTSKGAIQTAFRTYDLDARKSYRADDYPANHFFVRSGEAVGAEYEVVRTSVDYQTERVLVHRLIAIALGKMDPADLCNWDVIVHHESEHGLDNRHDNLEVMERGEHQRMHMLKNNPMN